MSRPLFEHGMLEEGKIDLKTNHAMAFKRYFAKYKESNMIQTNYTTPSIFNAKQSNDAIFIFDSTRLLQHTCQTFFVHTKTMLPCGEL